jgi:hypothetical protein
MSGDVARSLVEKLKARGHAMPSRGVELWFYPATLPRASDFSQATEEGNREKEDFTRL